MKIGDKVEVLYDIEHFDEGDVAEIVQIFQETDSIIVKKINGAKIYLQKNVYTTTPFLKTTPEVKTGTRHNSNKLRWRNFPKFLMRPVVEVGQFGETKYATFNFLKGLPVLDTLDSLDRHRDALDDPTMSDIDEESKCHHLACIAWNALVALHMIKTRPDLDDRYKGEKSD